ncbi:uracil-DNA glycosylase [Salipiger bermudensis]|uniref:uracil-DNA glycosylase n=1 Tax=Salipiger bermudensis TaxID=344736 RepID=UPI001C991301|nr:uracil-DNA glycosylase [Salipiger bermudensis]MBY6003676.1 uracil-DNA glycosylase [Salipiger bermudensis]
MDSGLDWHYARAALEWQLELGADEAIGEAPVDRFAVEVELQAARAAAAVAQPAPRGGGGMPPPKIDEGPDPVAVAKQAAAAAATLDDLRAAMAAFEHCELKRGARNLVFSDGVAEARVMIVGEAPGRDEDLQGKPFVGRAGQLLDRMLGAIGLSRAESVYITNVLPWRPPQNRDPKPDEIAMMTPFLARHIELVAPEVLVIMGNISCDALLGKRGITRLRGKWAEVQGRPALPMFHPAYLLRQPQMKREAWADLLELKAKLRAGA